MTSKQVTSPPWNSRRGAQAKKWFGHCAGLSPCAHSIGKFFLCYIVLFLLETSAPGLSGHYWYIYIYIFFFKLFARGMMSQRYKMARNTMILFKVLQSITSQTCFGFLSPSCWYGFVCACQSVISLPLPLYRIFHHFFLGDRNYQW